MKKLKETITTKYEDGNELQLDVKQPSGKLLQEAQRIYSSVWAKAINDKDNKLILRAKLDSILRGEGLWDDQKQEEERKLTQEIASRQAKLKRGGITKSEGREIAVGIIKLRNDLRNLIADRLRIDSHTAEAHADNAQFNFLVSQCVVDHKDGTPYFKSYEDYQDRAGETAARDSAKKLMEMLYEVPDDADNQLPEIKFLRAMKFINDEKDFVDPQTGHLVDIDGRNIDKDGYLVDEQERRIDAEGNLLEEKVESSPFVDENGQSVTVEF